MSERKPVTPESLYELRWVSDVRLAPDGRRVAYVEHWVEEIEKDGKKRKGYRSAIYLSEGPQAEPRRLTYAAKGSDSAPRWSPDGRMLAFLSTREGDQPQLYVLSLDGGEARPVTTPDQLSEGVIDYDWHPSGALFALLSRGHRSEEERQREIEHDEKVYEGRLPFKFDGQGLFDPRRAQIYRVRLDGTQLTRLTDWPRDLSDITWSPDGERLAFVSQNEDTPEYVWINDIFVLAAEGGTPERITPGTLSLGSPVWSPDGRQLAFIGHDRRRGNASVARLWTIDLQQRVPRCLTEGFDGDIGDMPGGDSHLGAHPREPVWNERDGLTVAALVRGHAGLYHVPLAGGAPEPIATSALSVVGFTQRGATIAFVGETNARSGEVYTLTPDGALQRRSRAGDAFFNTYAVHAPQPVRFKGADDWDLEGWVLRPAGGEGARHPLIIYVHGGPHSAYGNAFFHEFQALVAAGFALFFTNPRGSSSYGEEFADAVRRHFGEKDYADIMAAADLAASWDWVDPARMGIMGGSYGGYMTNWIITHTDRFAAACTQRSISNLLSFAGTSDIGPEFSRDEFGGLPWTDEELLMAKSPIRYVQNVKTPTLILHQEEDHRCPIEQAEQLYTALVVLGVPVKFVRFPGECHELPRSGQPFRRVNRMHHIIDWFTRYLRPAGSAAPQA
ncbi:prolyl oligopeptidase family serine peptidase [Kallotenue papyrolyticum]|uniref:S9 family peptidase n=1 Tax=Kallotenue papyrolyticum TaxID=1325125 RepID=UPI00047859DA|nr:S9 family peptidase [Kallotenue papyrolyticum]